MVNTCETHPVKVFNIFISLHTLSLVSTCCGVFEGEARFGLSQLMEVVEAHDVGRLEMALRVLVAFPAASYFVVQLGGGQGSQEGRVGTGDAHSII